MPQRTVNTIRYLKLNKIFNYRSILSILLLAQTTIFKSHVLASNSSSTNQTNLKILILIHGSQTADSELTVIKTPLVEWGFMVDVFDYSEDYQVAHDSVGGDHWYSIMYLEQTGMEI